MENLIDQINTEVDEMNKEKEKATTETPKKKRGRPVKVQNEIFVEMWKGALDGGSLQEVAGSLGISPASCSVKASNMRKAGYDLPQFKRGRPKKVQ